MLDSYGTKETGMEESQAALLIVEDDSDLRELLAEECAAFAREVITSGNGLEALEIIRNNPRVKAVCTDFVIPGITGLELYQKLAQQGIKLPFVMMSGCEDHLVSNLQMQGIHVILRKPLDINEFLAATRKAMIQRD